MRQASVREADADGADDLLLFASVERLRGITQRLKLDPAMHVPRAVGGATTTIRTRWCSVSASAHTAQSNFSGTDANGKAWSITGPVVRLLAK